MKVPASANPSLSDHEIATGLWLAFENACRLIDDAKVLYSGGRYLSAQASLHIAVEEIAKAQLLTQAIYYEKDDKQRWKRMWKDWDSHKGKLRFIEALYHQQYRDDEALHERINVLVKAREWLWYIDFDWGTRAYRTPLIRHASAEEAGRVAQIDLEYAQRLLEMVSLPSAAGSFESVERRIPTMRQARRRSARSQCPPIRQ